MTVSGMCDTVIDLYIQNWCTHNGKQCIHQKVEYVRLG